MGENKCLKQFYDKNNKNIHMDCAIALLVYSD